MILTYIMYNIFIFTIIHVIINNARREIRVIKYFKMIPWIVRLRTTSNYFENPGWLDVGMGISATLKKNV